MGDSSTAGAQPADPAVERHLRRLRPWRIGYAVGVVGLIAALLVVVKVAYSVGEISHVTLRTAPSAPADVALATPSARPVRAWTSSDRSALGSPYVGGTVVTWDEHAMRGRNGRTGAVTWSYTRTDRTLCAALQTDGVAIAVYENKGNCDELTGLDAQTGERRWTRTLDKDSNRANHAIDGHPHYAVEGTTVLIWTATVAYAIDPGGDQYTGNQQAGLDRWVFGHNGCTIGDIVLGSAGALISQTCTGQDCTDLKFCRNGAQLLLRDGFRGEDNDSDTNNGNADQLKWNIANSGLVPISAGTVVAARTSDGTSLETLSASRGAVLHRIALSGGSGDSSSVSASDADLIRFGGITYALQAGASAFSWQAETAGAPTVLARSGSTDSFTPTLAKSLVTVPAADGVAELDSGTGEVSASFAVSAPPAGSQVYPYGTGFLVAGSTTTVYR